MFFFYKRNTYKHIQAQWIFRHLAILKLLLNYAVIFFRFPQKCVVFRKRLKLRLKRKEGNYCNISYNNSLLLSHVCNLYLYIWYPFEYALIAKKLLEKEGKIEYIRYKSAVKLLLFCCCKKNHKLQWSHVKCKQCRINN